MGIVGTEDRAWLETLRHRHSSAPDVFVETGTGTGALTRIALGLFAIVHTVELSPTLVAAHHPELAALGANCWEGDSAVVTPLLARKIGQPVFWYLDAHWFDGGPDVAVSELSLLAELAAIATREYPDVVVVDDVNCFEGRGPQLGWSAISIERIAGFFPGAREVVTLGDQLAVYR